MKNSKRIILLSLSIISLQLFYVDATAQSGRVRSKVIGSPDHIVIPDSVKFEYFCTTTKVTIIPGTTACPGGSCTVYWQGTSCTTSSMSTASPGSLTVSSSTTRYYRIRDGSTWGPCTAVTITVNSYVPNNYTLSVNKTSLLGAEPLIVTMTYNGTPPAPTLSYTYNWGDGNIQQGGNPFHSYTASGNYTVTVTPKTVPFNCSYVYTQPIVVLAAPLCITAIPNAIGDFKVDNLTGDILYSRNDCPVQALFGCGSGQSTLQNKIISANATTFSDNWPYKTTDLKSASEVMTTANSYESGEKGKWRPKASYTYNTPLTTDERNYSAGYFNYQRFNWSAEAANGPKWIRASEILSYSPNGDALTERNPLDIRSTAKFGYNNALPVLTAQNADSESVLFESFEMNYNYGGQTYFEDGLKLTAGATVDPNFHSGAKSLKLSSSVSFTSRSMYLSPTSRKVSVKVWVKLFTQASYATLGNNLKANVNGTLVNMKVVARTGDWILCHAIVTPPATTFTVTLQYSVSEPIWLDDLRIQPADAVMNCYVYDKNTLRLLATFDDQHFGMYYQYNSEGKLIRKLIETRDGLKTLQESQYNTTLVQKPN